MTCGRACEPVRGKAEVRNCSLQGYSAGLQDRVADQSDEGALVVRQPSGSNRLVSHGQAPLAGYGERKQQRFRDDLTSQDSAGITAELQLGFLYERQVIRETDAIRRTKNVHHGDYRRVKQHGEDVAVDF